MREKLKLAFVILFISTICLLIAGRLSGIFIVYKLSDDALLPSYSYHNFVFASSLKSFTYNGLVYFTLQEKSGKNITQIRRIAGLEGDTLEINNGYLLRNGFMADNPDTIMLNYYAYRARVRDYKIFDNLKVKPVILKDSVLLCLNYPEYETMSRYLVLHKTKANESSTISFEHPNQKTLIVPKGHCFVLADNRNNYEDSRQWGFVPVADIKGVVIK